jgi:hypothetical protein
MKWLLDRVVFTDFTLRSVFRTNSSLAEVVLVKFATWPQVCTVLCETSKQAVNLYVPQDGRCPSTGILKYWTQKLGSLKSVCYAIMNKYPDITSVVQEHTEFTVTLRTLPDAH